MILGCLLVQWFQAVDQDRSNAIDAAELQKALALGNLHFSLAVCAHMIRYIQGLPRGLLACINQESLQLRSFGWYIGLATSRILHSTGYMIKTIVGQ